MKKIYDFTIVNVENSSFVGKNENWRQLYIGNNFTNSILFMFPEEIKMAEKNHVKTVDELTFTDEMW